MQYDCICSSSFKKALPRFNKGLMIGHIAKHELRRHVRNGRVRTLLYVTIVMLVASLILSFRDYRVANDQYMANLSAARANWESQSEKDPHDAAHDGTYVIKPIYPLAMIDKGINQFSGQVVHLGAHERKQSTLNEAKDNSGMFRFGELTPGFILTYLVPLLLIFLGYNTFTEEKEKQTIRLLLVQGVSLSKLAVGKWLALFLQMIVLWILLFAGAFIISQSVGSSILVSVSEWLALGGIYLFYFVIFINLIVWVSAKASTSGVSLTTLLTIWIIITLIIPKVSTNLAGWSHPFPTLQTFRDNINEDQANGLNGHNFWNEAAQDFKQKVLDQYGVETVEDLPIAYGGLLLAEGEKYESEIYTKHFDLLQSQYEKQRTIYRWCGILSPMLSVKFFSMAIARTDYGFLWHFEDEAEKYRVAFNTTLNMNIAENAKGVDQYTAGRELWSTIPRFDYAWQPSQSILNNHLVEFASIFLWAGLSFLLAIFFSRKIKVI